MDPVFHGTFERGKVHLFDAGRYQKYLEGQFAPGERVEVIVRHRRRRPTHAQHKFYRGVLLPLIAEECGNPLEIQHRILKREFFGRPRSLGSIWRALFTEFLEYVVWRATDLGIIVTDLEYVDV